MRARLPFTMTSEKDLESGVVPEDINAQLHTPRRSTDTHDEKIRSLDAERNGGVVNSKSDLSITSIDPTAVENLQSINPSQSHTSSVQSRPVSIVPRSRRRGLFGRFTIIPEVERPQEYANSTKWLITGIVALAGAAAPMGSAIFFRMYFINYKFLQVSLQNVHFETTRMGTNSLISIEYENKLIQNFQLPFLKYQQSSIRLPQ